MTFSSDSGTLQRPQLISSADQDRSACASVYCALADVQFATFFSTYSGRSDELIVREPKRDLALGRFRGVGAVDEVVRHRERQVAANRTRCRLGRIGRADRRAQRCDRSLSLDDERERRARGDELDELAEERLLPVFGVVRLAELAADVNQLSGPEREPAAFDAREDLAGEAPLDRVRLDQDQ